MSFIKKHKIEVFVVTFLIALAGFAVGTVYGSYHPADFRMEGRFSDKRMEMEAENGDGFGQNLPDGCMPDRGGRKHMPGGGEMDGPDGRMMPGQRPDGDTEPGNNQKPDTSTQPGQKQTPDDSTDTTEKKKDNGGQENSTDKKQDTTTQPEKNKTNNTI